MDITITVFRSTEEHEIHLDKNVHGQNISAKNAVNARVFMLKLIYSM